MAPLPPRDQRHRFLRYEGLEYTDSDIADFELRLERIYTLEIHRVQVVDFLGMLDLLRDGLFARMMMEHRDKAGVVVFTSQRMSWRQFILALGLHTGEEMESPDFTRYWRESERMIPGKGDLHDYWRDILTDGDFLRPPPFYTLIRDPVLRLCQRMMAHSIAGRSQAPEKVTVTDLFYLRGLDVGSINIPYLLARYLRRFVAGRKSRAHIFGRQFMGRLAQHFGLLTTEILRGLTVIAPDLQMIDMAKLPDAVAGAPADAEDALIVDEGGQADPAPGLCRYVGSLRGLVERSMTDQGRFSTWMMTCMMQLIYASGLTYQALDESFRGSSPTAFQRQTSQRTGEVSTSTAQYDQQYPDP
ncbi:hypothetical protein Tco_0450014 [Tanacetum coccineum]